jgi:hypothetical protein
MEFEFPIYPFIWDYSDMYNLIEYESTQIEQIEQIEQITNDENIQYLLEKFPGSQVIDVKQSIKSREFAKNINIHTWYLGQKKVFESDEKTIKIITNSRIKFKSQINCFIFDPNDIFNKIEKEQTKNFPQICIIKNKKSIIPELIPSLYIHTHNIKGIFRFSPNDNNKINIKENITDGIFYIQMDKLIVKFNVIFI